MLSLKCRVKMSGVGGESDVIPTSGAMASLAEQKLKSFSIGTMGNRAMSRKELEENREVRKREHMRHET